MPPVKKSPARTRFAVSSGRAAPQPQSLMDPAVAHKGAMRRVANFPNRLYNLTTFL